MSEDTENKYLLMPDSFKGTMDAIEVCEIMRSAILQCDPDADIVSVPVADGGEDLPGTNGMGVVPGGIRPAGGRIPGGQPPVLA